MYFSLPIVVSLLVSSVSALATPHGPHARDTSLAARRHHIPRRANSHPLSRRSARRKRCLQRTTLPASSSSSSSPAVTTSNDPVLDVPVNVAHAPPTTTPTTQAPVQPTTTTPDYAPPQQPTNPTSPPSTGGGNGETHSGDGTFFDVGLVRTGLFWPPERRSALTPVSVPRVPAARLVPTRTTWLLLDGSCSTRSLTETRTPTTTLSAAGRSALLVSPHQLHIMVSCSYHPSFTFSWWKIGHCCCPRSLRWMPAR
jgi:hypothetical protein